MPPDTLTPHQFVNNWRNRKLTERESSQAHFIELCRLLGVPAPYQNRALDNDYRFDAITATGGSHAYTAARSGRSSKKAPRAPETSPLFDEPENPRTESVGLPQSDAAQPELPRITSASKGHGFADVWKRGCFCWEYKRQGHADRHAAYEQLKQYRDSLENPPLLIVCDIDCFDIYTNFTGYPTEHHHITLEDLANPSEEWHTHRAISPINLLRKIFDPVEIAAYFKPKKSVNAITEDRAAEIADLADQIRERKDKDGNKPDPYDVAHFLMQIIFAFYAEDAGLLREGLVTELVQATAATPERFTSQIRDLFEQMERGGDFGPYPVDHFNGGLFKGVSKQRIPQLASPEIGKLAIIAKDDWTAIEPSILGTLFERALNPDKRAQIGAHYTSRDDIMLIVGPVVIDPLRREWQQTQARVNDLLLKRAKPKGPEAAKKIQQEIERDLRTFHDRLCSVTILDPACGSGNFLYVTIQCLLDLEREVIAFASIDKNSGGPGLHIKQRVRPTQLHGIELNDLAAELARISIWIGYLKWMRENGQMRAERPILDALDTIKQRDAILDQSDPKKPKPAEWPKTDFIVGNPPFLGSKLFRAWGMKDEYLKDLFKVYDDLPGTIDLCCYWFELARRAIERNPATRCGLLATQGIRGGDNRTVLERIKETGDIFMAWADREWTLDGAAVQVSMVGFDAGTELNRRIGMLRDGKSILVPASQINADLSTGTNVVAARPLSENHGMAFMGDTKGGSFDIAWSAAAHLLASVNASRVSNSAVVVPWFNGVDITRRARSNWIIDFGTVADRADAARFEAPFAHIEHHVQPERRDNRREAYRSRWWLHVEPRPAMWKAIRSLSRYVATPTLTKHRLFAFLDRPSVPDHQLIVFARSDDYFFGFLHSSIHEIWARGTGTQLREAESGFRYTPTSTFETFPLPWSPGKEPTDPKAKHHTLWKAIGDAAKQLNDLREAWLNPPEWIAAVEKQVDIKYREELAAVPDDVRPLVRRSAVMAEAANHKDLKLRTLTNLYNQRPAWLRIAHEKLDRAVLAAYQAVDPSGNWDPEWASTYEPYGAGEITIRAKGTKAAPADPPDIVAKKQAAIAKREIVDAKILAALLRLNHERAGATPPKVKKPQSVASATKATKTRPASVTSSKPDPAKRARRVSTPKKEPSQRAARRK